MEAHLLAEQRAPCGDLVRRLLDLRHEAPRDVDARAASMRPFRRAQNLQRRLDPGKR
jgi:hypothetical protein